MNIDWGSIASVATAIGVAIGVWQIRESAKIARAQFEDSLDQQYRVLSHGIPVDALIGKRVREDQAEETRELIYNYLDLCNEQVFLRSKRKVRRDTWQDWNAGMQSHLKKPAFCEIWDEIKIEAPGTFNYLERLEREEFATDPIRWK